jgi:hypothetical protein
MGNINGAAQCPDVESDVIDASLQPVALLPMEPNLTPAGTDPATGVPVPPTAAWDYFITGATFQVYTWDIQNDTGQATTTVGFSNPYGTGEFIDALWAPWTIDYTRLPALMASLVPEMVDAALLTRVDNYRTATLANQSFYTPPSNSAANDNDSPTPSRLVTWHTAGTGTAVCGIRYAQRLVVTSGFDASTDGGLIPTTVTSDHVPSAVVVALQLAERSVLQESRWATEGVTWTTVFVSPGAEFALAQLEAMAPTQATISQQVSDSAGHKYRVLQVLDQVGNFVSTWTGNVMQQPNQVWFEEGESIVADPTAYTVTLPDGTKITGEALPGGTTHGGAVGTIAWGQQNYPTPGGLNVLGINSLNNSHLAYPLCGGVATVTWRTWMPKLLSCWTGLDARGAPLIVDTTAPTPQTAVCSRLFLDPTQLASGGILADPVQRLYYNYLVRRHCQRFADAGNLPQECWCLYPDQAPQQTSAAGIEYFLAQRIPLLGINLEVDGESTCFAPSCAIDKSTAGRGHLLTTDLIDATCHPSANTQICAVQLIVLNSPSVSVAVKSRVQQYCSTPSLTRLQDTATQPLNARQLAGSSALPPPMSMPRARSGLLDLTDWPLDLGFLVACVCLVLLFVGTSYTTRDVTTCRRRTQART